MRAHFVSAALISAASLCCSPLFAQPRLPPAKPIRLLPANPIPPGRGVIGDAARLDRLPDLQVNRFSATGPLETRSDGTHALPVTLTVRNAGTASAARFKISAQATSGGAPHLVGISEDRSTDPSFIWTASPLAAAAETTLRGHVIIPRSLSGHLVITVVADSRAEEDLLAAYGRVRETNEDNNISSGLTVDVPVHVAAGAPPAHPVPVVPTPPSVDETWRLGASRLWISSKSEESGDEPYFIVIGFRARLSTSGSASAVWNGDLHELADDKEHGEVLIPSSMGVVQFDRVRRVTLADYLGGMQPEILGVVVIAMESDETPFSDVRVIANRARAAVQAEADSIANATMEERDRWRADPIGTLNAAIARVQKSVELNLRERLVELNRSLFSPDDQIGFSAKLFLAVDRELEPAIRAEFGDSLTRLKTAHWTTRYTGESLDFGWDVINFAETGRGVVP
jgi:hypothetical protein